jgi:tetratricopeptide (TPR) repeat protein
MTTLKSLTRYFLHILVFLTLTFFLLIEENTVVKTEYSKSIFFVLVILFFIIFLLLKTLWGKNFKIRLNLIDGLVLFTLLVVFFNSQFNNFSINHYKIFVIPFLGMYFVLLKDVFRKTYNLHWFLICLIFIGIFSTFSFLSQNLKVEFPFQLFQNLVGIFSNPLDFIYITLVIFSILISFAFTESAVNSKLIITFSYIYIGTIFFVIVALLQSQQLLYCLIFITLTSFYFAKVLSKHHLISRAKIHFYLVPVLLSALGYFILISVDYLSPSRIDLWGLLVSGFDGADLFLGTGYLSFLDIFHNSLIANSNSSIESIKVTTANSAYSSYFHFLLENGILGAILILAVIVLIFMLTNKADKISVATRVSFICILFISLFFGSQNLLFYIIILAFLSLLNTYSFESRTINFFLPKKVTVTLLALIILLTAFSVSKVNEIYKGIEEWQMAQKKKSSYNYVEASSSYKKIYETFVGVGEFHQSYGEAQLFINPHLAIEEFEKAKFNNSNYILYYKIGDCYNKILDIYNAKKAYDLSILIDPNKHFPRYKLEKIERVINMETATGQF